MDDELTHAAIMRFEAIEARLDALEGGGEEEEEDPPRFPHVTPQDEEEEVEE